MVMKNTLARLPLVKALQSLSKTSAPGTKFLYGVMAGICLFLFTLPWVPRTQDAMVAKFHLRSASFFQWAALQLIPSMYNFGNEIWISYQPLTAAVLEGKEPLSGGAFHGWVNHHPLRLISFSVHRKNFSTGTYYVYLRSGYRGRNFYSTFILKGNPQGLRLERLP